MNHQVFVAITEATRALDRGESMGYHRDLGAMMVTKSASRIAQLRLSVDDSRQLRSDATLSNGGDSWGRDAGDLGAEHRCSERPTLAGAEELTYCHTQCRELFSAALRCDCHGL